MTVDVSSIFLELKRSAARLGGCDPLWLKNEQVPAFNVVEGVEAGLNGQRGRVQNTSQRLPEMVLLHGLFGALSNWDGTLPFLKKYCRPIALEFPLTRAHRSEVKVKALSVFTEFFIRSRNLQPVAVCGNSLGGHVALRLALASPEMVDCLILSGASGLYEHSVDTLPVRPDREFIRDHMSRVFVNQEFVTEEAVSEIYSILSDRSNVLNIIHAARSAKKDNLLDLLSGIQAPTLLLWGEDDEVTSLEVAETFHKNIPRAELVTVKDCGHAPMIEHPEWFAEEVGKFLKKHSRYYRSNSDNQQI